MARDFTIKEIAHQAGLSTATVDRVLNGREGVRKRTAARVEAALRELAAQEAQLALTGRALTIDLIAEAPGAFLDALQQAVRHELPLIQTAIFRTRSDLRARFPIPAFVSALERAQRLASDGVILMAPDAPDLRAAMAGLSAAGVPVVTLATDMPGAPRTGYAGLDNVQAGQTAAWMIRRWLPDAAAPHILITQRNEAFRGEADRAQGFRTALQAACPEARVTQLAQGAHGPGFAAHVAEVARDHPPAALYSIGGGTRALLAELAAQGLSRPMVIGHDLDDENRALLRDGALDAVLYHDFADDIRHACQVFLSVHSRGAVPMPQHGTPLRIMLPPMLSGG